MARFSDKWYQTNDYARAVFGDEPAHIRATREAVAEAGLPDWAVTPEVGRFLAMLARTTGGRTALEVGTLGGYSTLWLLEGMAPEGRIVTIEYDDHHADVAAAEFDRHGLSDRVDLRRGTALDLLPGIVSELGPRSLDLVFIDADKESLPEYYDITSDLVVPGGLLIVDNIFGTGQSWIDDMSDPGIAATDRMNRTAAADERFETAGLFVRSGLLVSRRR